MSRLDVGENLNLKLPVGWAVRNKHGALRGPQSRGWSLTETLINVGSGFILSWAVWTYIVAPHYGYASSTREAFGITLIFTVTSVIRSYLWRRGFEWLMSR